MSQRHNVRRLLPASLRSRSSRASVRLQSPVLSAPHPLVMPSVVADLRRRPLIAHFHGSPHMPSSTVEFSISIEVHTDAAALWDFVISPAGFAHELGPNLRMTVPTGFQGRPSDLSDGQVVGSSTVLLFGWIPIERARITILEIAAPQRIRELHSTILFRQWQQHRSLSPLGPNRTLVVDTIAFSLRRPWSGIPASENLARHAWRNHIQARQRRLAQLFATSPTRQQAQ